MWEIEVTNVDIKVTDKANEMLRVVNCDKVKVNLAKNRRSNLDLLQVTYGRSITYYTTPFVIIVVYYENGLLVTHIATT